MLLATTVALALIGGCSGDAHNLSGCDYGGAIDNGGVTLEGSAPGPGTSGDGSFDLIGGDGSSTDVDCTPSIQNCRQIGTLLRTPNGSPVTLADIAHFAPTVGDHLTEPDGWAVRGLPINLISTAQPHVVHGTLLGNPASVRFTPVAWRWNHGDGTSAIRSTGGATWAQQRADEFERTATSHVFTERGRHTITLDVVFRAEYRIGPSNWISISGTLALPAPPRSILSTTARTVLVDEDCIQNPSGPGC